LFDLFWVVVHGVAGVFKWIEQSSGGETGGGSSQVVDEELYVEVALGVGVAGIGFLEELFGEPVEGLCGIEFQQIGAISFPECFFALFPHDPASAVDDVAVGLRESALIHELLHGLHAEAYEINGVG
jgi:hypothetical protein